MGLKPSAMPTTGSGWRCATLCVPEPCDPGRRRAEAPMRPRSDTSCSTSRGLTGQGPAGFRRPTPLVRHPARTRRTRCWLAALLRDAGSETRASPQPDPLGHLMSRDRGAPDGEPGAVRPPPQTSWSGTPPTIPPREPFRAHVASARTRFRGVQEPRTEGRFTRTSAKRFEIGCTRGAFHRPATGTRDTGLSPCIAGLVGPSPQVVTNLWTTLGAVPSLAGPCSDPAALTGGRRRGLGLPCEP